MKVLLDTNIVIHREASHVVNEDIGEIFNWLDRLHFVKCIHPVTIKEIERHLDPRTVQSMAIKLRAYNLLKTKAPTDPRVQALIDTTDKNENDVNDSRILNELVCDRVDFFITEDRTIHKKALLLSISDRVFTIAAFLEKVAAENPNLVDYRVLSVRKELLGNINLQDWFFESFREDYHQFDKWFNRKSDEVAYVCKSAEQVIAFLYLKFEGQSEDYSDITPPFTRKKRLKIGSFKVDLNPFKLGERLLKIIFDNALALAIDEIYVTIFPKRVGQVQLIELLKDWGFSKHGKKSSFSGTEDVYARDFTPRADIANPCLTFPYISGKSETFIVPIYPKYHTELFPDSILRTESPLNFVENEPHRNAIRKVYISRSIERDLKSGDVIIFYRTGGYYESVVTTLGIVESVVTSIKDEKDFVRLCRKRSIFSDQQLIRHWNYKPNDRPFIVNFLYVYSFPKRPNMKRLIELGIIRDVESAPRGFTPITDQQFKLILREANANASLVIY